MKNQAFDRKKNILFGKIKKIWMNNENRISSKKIFYFYFSSNEYE
jgi:hypothetical protein